MAKATRNTTAPDLSITIQLIFDCNNHSSNDVPKCTEDALSARQKIDTTGVVESTVIRLMRELKLP